MLKTENSSQSTTCKLQNSIKVKIVFVLVELVVLIKYNFNKLIFLEDAFFFIPLFSSPLIITSSNRGLNSNPITFSYYY